jgi:hypothetical protein
MSTGESLDPHVSVESSTNGNIVKERPLPDQGTLQLMGRPRVVVQDQGDRSSGRPSSTVSRLLPVEGLRAYLALWVLVAMPCGHRAMRRKRSQACPS